MQKLILSINKKLLKIFDFGMAEVTVVKYHVIKYLTELLNLLFVILIIQILMYGVLFIHNNYYSRSIIIMTYQNCICKPQENSYQNIKKINNYIISEFKSREIDPFTKFIILKPVLQ
ncbi:unnamed protein product [Paramecium sonneborni]|uniref:Uncharacterized protein n=1 Tax=Paramecium sonneborni TaxID=65129 RepID=A0A8S1R857_9CILI|nr:unnamed protein product [Paramecium sonneborni]